MHRPGPDHLRTHACPPARFIPPIRTRHSLGNLLQQLNYTGAGAELGVRRGEYSWTLLSRWKQCSHFVQVDAWQSLANYADASNVDNATVQLQRRQQSMGHMLDAKRAGYVQQITQCPNFTSVCVHDFADGYFDFVYVDARHDRTGVLVDLSEWWPKIRRGGLMAGHDYTEQKEPGRLSWHGADPASSKQDWTLNSDGTKDLTGRVVRGAVDDFFSGVAAESPPELRRCPRQVVVAYRELAYNTWMVTK